MAIHVRFAGKIYYTWSKCSETETPLCRECTYRFKRDPYSRTVGDFIKQHTIIKLQNKKYIDMVSISIFYRRISIRKKF